MPIGPPPSTDLEVDVSDEPVGSTEEPWVKDGHAAMVERLGTRR
jgi:hypothetical protein